MQPISKLWESKVLIRFSDCDPFNHLNNARYIDYFINAREDHILANMNFNIYEFAAEHGLGWVVSKNQIVYLKPANLVETVVIDSALLKLTATDLLIEMKMWNERKDKLKSVMWTNLVHINIKTQRPENHSQDLLDKFKPFEDPKDANISFDERVSQLRNK
ncbi:MAG TPA: acyl-CoA thioesterase [Chitinophagaceae bacterium]|nr:acyl-CoA thioesterase [Chitinophagaceae bacterium]